MYAVLVFSFRLMEEGLRRRRIDNNSGGKLRAWSTPVAVLRSDASDERCKFPSFLTGVEKHQGVRSRGRTLFLMDAVVVVLLAPDV